MKKLLSSKWQIVYNISFGSLYLTGSLITIFSSFYKTGIDRLGLFSLGIMILGLFALHFYRISSVEEKAESKIKEIERNADQQIEKIKDQNKDTKSIVIKKETEIAEKHTERLIRCERHSEDLYALTEIVREQFYNIQDILHRDNLNLYLIKEMLYNVSLSTVTLIGDTLSLFVGTEVFVTIEGLDFKIYEDKLLPEKKPEEDINVLKNVKIKLINSTKHTPNKLRIERPSLLEHNSLYMILARREDIYIPSLEDIYIPSLEEQPEINSTLFRRGKQICLFVPDVRELSDEYNAIHGKGSFKMTNGRKPNHFKSTIITPIHCYSGMQTPSHSDLHYFLGFITVSAKEPNVFNTSDSKLFINYLCTCASIIYCFFERCSTYKKYLKLLSIYKPLNKIINKYDCVDIEEIIRTQNYLDLVSSINNAVDTFIINN